MDITPQDNTATQPISDDQELAKALAGVLPDEPEAPAPVANELQFEETPAPVAVAAPAVDTTATATPPITLPDLPAIDTPAPEAAEVSTPAFATPTASSSLEGIKNQALNELRPLIDHVDLPAEEKFDTYLMLIRSTDDSTLIEPAHAAAQGIADEKRKAEALLEIIKEIDYLSRKDQQSAA